MVTDQSGTLVARHDYLPFGDEIPNGYAGRPSNGTWSGSDTVAQKFTGKERDSESGLDYFGARYYGSSLGRFTSVDPDPANMDVTNPQTFNRYAYVWNNPLANTDPDGADTCADGSYADACVTDKGPPPIDTVPFGPGPTQQPNPIIQQIQQAGQQIFNWLSQPRDPNCMMAAMAKGGAIGTGVGLVGGGLAGIEIGPGAAATAYAGAQLLGPPGAAAGYTAGLFSCMSSSGSGGGSGASGGNGGTQVTSKTLWRDGKGGRIDVENPNPGQRPGQIHYQDQTGKYLYDPQTGQFDGAPNRVNQILSDPMVQQPFKKEWDI